MVNNIQSKHDHCECEKRLTLASIKWARGKCPKKESKGRRWSRWIYNDVLLCLALIGWFSSPIHPSTWWVYPLPNETLIEDDRKQGRNVALIDTQTVPVDHCLYLCVYECVQPCCGASSRHQEVSWVLKHIFVVAKQYYYYFRVSPWHLRNQRNAFSHRLTLERDICISVDHLVLAKSTTQYNYLNSSLSLSANNSRDECAISMGPDMGIFVLVSQAVLAS